MKKKLMALLLFFVSITTVACAKKENEDKKCACTCEACLCEKENESLTNEMVDAAELFVPEKTTAEETKSVVESSEEENSTADEVTSTVEQEKTEEPVVTLSESEKAARKQLLTQLYQVREQLYKEPASLSKTLKINEIDKQIIDNSCVNFKDKTISFIGDSITAGIGGRLDSEGNQVSYVDYAKKTLNIGNAIKNGKPGRMVASYGDDSYSLKDTIEQNVYMFSDAIVIFLGVNDYLIEQNNKRYGELDVNSYSDAGFCGGVRSICKFFNNNLPDMPIFFVTTYNFDHISSSTFSDMPIPPSYSDYMNKLKETVKNYGMNVIDLYNTDFMNCKDLESKSRLLADSVHPNDEGYQLLGDHIAAELVYYFSQK